MTSGVTGFVCGGIIFYLVWFIVGLVKKGGATSNRANSYSEYSSVAQPDISTI